MDWLNYHHLLYFWAIAREGSLARASEELHVSQSTISGQVRTLEESLGEKLFRRSGRRLVLTEIGNVAFRYADEIFTLGREFLSAVRGRESGRPMRLVVGVADVLPKPIVKRLLEPAFHVGEPVRVICREDRPVAEFMGQLSIHGLDLVLADTPLGQEGPVRAFSHLLGECGTTFFAAGQLADRVSRRFPRALDGAPYLTSGVGSTLRRSIDQWFDSEGLRPAIVGEFDDSALMYTFGQDGMGVFAGPTVIEADIRRRYQVRVVGRANAVRQRFYAISVERKLRHPAVVAICAVARKELFG